MSTPPRPRALVRVAVALAMVTGMFALFTPPASAMRMKDMPIENLAGYEPQSTCMPHAKPGTRRLAHWLLRRYPVSHFVRIGEPCSGGGVSEHKEGRAFDWGVDVRYKKQRRAAYNFLKRLFATDAQGNQFALARRLGIMYIIWNDKIYSAYPAHGAEPFQARDYLASSCTSLSTCSRTARHKNHMHISLTRAGGWGQTSWYRHRGVKAKPVLVPHTYQLNPYETAYYGLQVPLDGTTVRTPFKLGKNYTYTIYVQGLYRTGTGSKIADPVCRWDDTSKTWVPITAADGYGLTIDGQLASSLFTPVYDQSSGTYSTWSCDPTTHSFTLQYSPDRNRPLTLSFLGTVPQFDASPISVHIVQEQLIPEIDQTPAAPQYAEPTPATTDGPTAAALTGETVAVPADSADGVLTTGAFVKGQSYTITVTGTAMDGATPFDAVCVNWDGVWEYTHTQNLTTPDADNLNLYLDGTKLALHPPSKALGQCSGTNTYTVTWTATHNGRLPLQVWDPNSYADNTGSLSVTIAPAS